MLNNDFRMSTKEFGGYFVNFYSAVIIGILFTIICDLPLKFIKIIDIDMGHFITSILGTSVALFKRSYSKGYNANSCTYTFKFKTVLLFVVMVFTMQIALVLIIGHAIYTTGPTKSLANYLVNIIHPSLIEKTGILNLYNWLLMIIADVFIYGPVMISGEYLGIKRHNKDFDVYT